MRSTRLLTAVRKALAALHVPSAGETIVVGLSGGADSVALLDAMVLLSRKGEYRVVAAHLDHRLRPGSAEDALFCRRLCEDLGVGFRAGEADVRARARRDRAGIEEAARLERYGFLRTVKEEEAAVAIAVAHTLDDQAETFLLRLLRGAGSAGLASMRPRAGDVLRPLLGVSRRDVIAHLRSRDLAWREDPTNADPALLRNRVRHELIPYLESRFNPRLRETLARSASLLTDEAEVLRGAAGELLERAVWREGGASILSRRALEGAPPALARLAVRGAIEEAGGLRGICLEHVDRILRLATSPAPSGRRLPLPGGREALFRFDEVWIGSRRTAAGPFAVPLPVPGRVELPGGLVLTAARASGPAASQGDSAVVEVPEGPLVIRTRRPGDRVRTRGREVSLKRVLREGRVPADLRAGLPLVASGPRVLWFPGLVEPGGGAGAGRRRPRSQGRLEGEPADRRRFVRLSIERSGAPAGRAFLPPEHDCRTVPRGRGAAQLELADARASLGRGRKLNGGARPRTRSSGARRAPRLNR